MPSGRCTELRDDRGLCRIADTPFDCPRARMLNSLRLLRRTTCHREDLCVAHIRRRRAGIKCLINALAIELGIFCMHYREMRNYYTTEGSTMSVIVRLRGQIIGSNGLDRSLQPRDLVRKRYFVLIISIARPFTSDSPAAKGKTRGKMVRRISARCRLKHVRAHLHGRIAPAWSNHTKT
jgi:hypothetical protein